MYLNKTQQIIAASLSGVLAIGAGIGIGAAIWSRGSSSISQTVMITDAGSVDDGSFNEQAYDATQQYAKLSGTSESYVKPSNTNKNTLTQLYAQYLSSGTESLVLPGFLHDNWAFDEDTGELIEKGAISDSHTEFPDQQFVFIDDGNQNFVNVDTDAFELAVANDDLYKLGDETIYVYQYTDTSGNIHNYNLNDGKNGWTSQDLHATTGYAYSSMFSSTDNVSSIKYYAEEAGFAVGIIASMYVTETFSNPADWTISGWTGLAFSTTLDYLSGYIQGVNFYNSYILGTIPAGETYYNLTNASGQYVKVVSPLGNDEIDSNGAYIPGNVYSTPDNDNWQTGSFDPGGSTTASEKAVNEDKKARVLFPIAGPQTADSLDEAESQPSKDIMVVGVDTDNSKVYEEQSDYILTSALKVINTESDDELYYDAGPTVRLLYDFQNYGVMADYIGTFANGGVGFTTSSETEALLDGVQSGDTANSAISYSIESGLETHLNSIAGGDWTNLNLNDFIVESINFINANNVKLADGNETGIQSIIDDFFTV